MMRIRLMLSKIIHHPLLHRLLRPMPLMLIASVLCFSGWFVLGGGGVWDSYQLRCRYERQQKQISELQSKRDWLQQRLGSLKRKDELALEHAARNFGLVAPGETIYEIKIDSTTK